MYDDLYLHVSSSDSLDYFPQNCPAAFRIKLNTPLYLVGRWKIGVCEIHVENLDIGTQHAHGSVLCVQCNVCTGMIVNGVQTRALRCCQIERKFHHIYEHIYYRPVERQFIDSIEFALTKGACTPASFAVDEMDGKEVDSGSVSLTLHLKRSK